MRKSFILLISLVFAAFSAQAQIDFSKYQEPMSSFDSTDNLTVIMPNSPLIFQVLFVGGEDMVQTTATYGNPAGAYPAKQWHDFIGWTPDETGTSLGWASINHERIEANDNIGDGGGMTVFRLERDANTDTLRVVTQTLDDGRTGEYFNVDFVNTVGETGMNCGGIVSFVDGRIWTAEEWFIAATPASMTVTLVSL
ncbi:MAG: phosphatase, partial [Bacteroidota bacterium]